MRGFRRLARGAAPPDRAPLEEVRAGFAELTRRVGDLQLDVAAAPDAAARKQRSKALKATRLGYGGLAELLGRYLVLEADGRAFVISPADARMFGRLGTNEARLLRLALKHLDAAGVQVALDVFVDGGANVGTECLAALAAGFGSVVACEPEAENFRLLQANVALNGEADRVRAVQVALSSETGRARLDPGNRTRRKARLVGEGEDAPGDVVQTASLDGLAADGVFDPARVGLLWLDVEGYECHVLKGAKTLRERSVPVVMELNIKLLGQAGALGELPDVLTGPYTHVLDLGAQKPGFEPMAALGRLIEQYGPEGGSNVLVARLASG